jgi:hypothetical protein
MMDKILYSKIRREGNTFGEGRLENLSTVIHLRVPF